MKDELNTLLQKEMDRKSFLQHVAIGFAVITGIGAVIKTLNGFGNSSSRNLGYGNSVYGGKPTDTSRKS